MSEIFLIIFFTNILILFHCMITIVHCMTYRFHFITFLYFNIFTLHKSWMTRCNPWAGLFNPSTSRCHCRTPAVMGLNHHLFALQSMKWWLHRAFHMLPRATPFPYRLTNAAWFDKLIFPGWKAFWIQHWCHDKKTHVALIGSHLKRSPCLMQHLLQSSASKKIMW